MSTFIDCEFNRDKVLKLERRIQALEAALRDMFALIDERFLVRNIEGDAASDWAIKTVGFLKRLANNHAILHDSTEAKG